MHIAAYKMLCAAEVAIAAAKDDTEPERNSLDAIRHIVSALAILHAERPLGLTTPKRITCPFCMVQIDPGVC